MDTDLWERPKRDMSGDMPEIARSATEGRRSLLPSPPPPCDERSVYLGDKKRHKKRHKKRDKKRYKKRHHGETQEETQEER